MDITEWVASAYAKGLAVWYALGPDGPYYVWVASGMLGVAVFLVFSYRLIRWALGHRKFRGHWNNPDQYHRLMQMLHEEQMNNRVLAFEELSALRAYKYGRSIKLLTDGRSGGYSD